MFLDCRRTIDIVYDRPGTIDHDSVRELVIVVIVVPDDTVAHLL